MEQQGIESYFLTITRDSVNFQLATPFGMTCVYLQMSCNDLPVYVFVLIDLKYALLKLLSNGRVSQHKFGNACDG